MRVRAAYQTWTARLRCHGSSRRRTKRERGLERETRRAFNSEVRAVPSPRRLSRGLHGVSTGFVREGPPISRAFAASQGAGALRAMR